MSTTLTPKLWEIADELSEIETVIFTIQTADDLTDAEKAVRIESTLTEWLSTGKAFEEKACNVAAWIKHLEALAEARRNEYRRLRALAEQAEKQAESLRSYLLANMQRTGKTKIQGTTANVSLRRKPARVILNCAPDELPQQFQKVEITPRLNDIKTHLKNNPECDFAELSTVPEFSLTIK